MNLNYNNAIRIRNILLILALTNVTSGCQSFLDLETPQTSINKLNVYESAGTATAVLTGIYSKLSSEFASGGLISISLRSELSADNLVLYDLNNNQYQRFFNNELQPSINEDTSYWRQIYSLLYVVNSAIEGIPNSKKLSEHVRNQLLGEAKFLRAFLHFYATNLYGNIPVIIETDYKNNMVATNDSKSKIYLQIIEDLKEAEQLLNEEYLDSQQNPSVERTRPNRYCATSLLSRVYLYYGDYENAENLATKVIESQDKYDLVATNEVFLKNSKETIWALQPVLAGRNTDDAYFMILPPSGPNLLWPIYLRDNLVSSYEQVDNRLSTWINNVDVDGNKYFYPYKYKENELNQPISEYNIVLRLSELFLIRAEARIRLGNNISQAVADLNKVRKRAGLSDLPSYVHNSSEGVLLDTLLEERRKEFFCEWGHRWLDLKRFGKANDFLSPLIEKSWQITDILYPIPESEIINNRNLIQNPGYQQ